MMNFVAHGGEQYPETHVTLNHHLVYNIIFPLVLPEIKGK